MSEILARATEQAILLINLIALAAIVYGTLEATVRAVRVLLLRSGGLDERAVWLRYAQWLVAGLTFQLAADIIETSIAPEWEDIGRLAAIAVIRTFLNYFLARDLFEVRENSAAGETVK